MLSAKMSLLTPPPKEHSCCLHPALTPACTPFLPHPNLLPARSSPQMRTAFFSPVSAPAQELAPHPRCPPVAPTPHCSHLLPTRPPPRTNPALAHPPFLYSPQTYPCRPQSVPLPNPPHPQPYFPSFQTYYSKPSYSHPHPVTSQAQPCPVQRTQTRTHPAPYAHPPAPPQPLGPTADPPSPPRNPSHRPPKSPSPCEAPLGGTNTLGSPTAAARRGPPTPTPHLPPGLLSTAPTASTPRPGLVHAGPRPPVTPITPRACPQHARCPQTSPSAPPCPPDTHPLPDQPLTPTPLLPPGLSPGKLTQGHPAVPWTCSCPVPSTWPPTAPHPRRSHSS